MNRLRGRATSNQPEFANNATGQAEPVEPVYYKPVSASPIASQLKTPSEATTARAPIVKRGQDTSGMRYLLSIFTQRQPLSILGTGPDIGMGVNSSQFQPYLTGPHRNAGFNDKLFRAGYPGFNLGLSFKVQALPTQTTGPGYSMRMRSSNITTRIIKVNMPPGVNTKG